MGVPSFGPIHDPRALSAALAEAITVVDAGGPCLIDVVIDEPEP